MLYQANNFHTETHMKNWLETLKGLPFPQDTRKGHEFVW